MAKGCYIGLGGTPRTVKSIYIGVGGAVRKVKEAYICIGGVIRKFYQSGVPAGQATFTSSQTWTVPAGVSKIDIFCVGGGAGSLDGRSGGGGGGYTATLKNASVTPGQQIAVTVGAGGTWVTGGASSFGSLLSAAGGGGCRDLVYENIGKSGGGNGGSGGAGDNSYSGSAAGYDGGKSDTCGLFSSYVYDTAGTGQGSTTRAFGEAGNTLYSGGGGCRNDSMQL
jgi:hypothetical protein